MTYSEICAIQPAVAKVINCARSEGCCQLSTIERYEAYERAKMRLSRLVGYYASGADERLQTSQAYKAALDEIVRGLRL